MSPKYKWNSPYEWLVERAGQWTPGELFHEFCTIAQQLDSDQIQDLYQSDMDRDGYFKEEK